MVSQHPKLVFRSLLVSAFCTLSLCTVQAQLGGKPYQQWTAKEAKGLLTDSPWAQTQTGPATVSGLGPRISVGRPDPRFDPPTEEMAVTISLRSGLPLRQALARLSQLKNKYDQKSDSDRVAIDAGNKTLLECNECADYYVVAMSPSAVPGPDPGPGLESVVGLPTGLRRMSLARVKLYVQIKNEEGDTRELVKFVAPKFATDDALFYFSRFDSKGEPLITTANRTLTISFDSRMFEWRRATTTKFEFDVAKITINGQVAF